MSITIYELSYFSDILIPFGILLIKTVDKKAFQIMLYLSQLMKSLINVFAHINFSAFRH